MGKIKYPLYPHKTHHILTEIKHHFLKSLTGDNLLNILQNNVVFIYPQTISISFIEYPVIFDSFNLSKDKINDDDVVMLREGDIKTNSVLSKGDWFSFFDNLILSLKSINFSPTIILDLRKLRIIDEDLLYDIINKYLFDSTIFHIIIFFHPDISDDQMKSFTENLKINLKINKISYINQIENLTFYYDNLISDSKSITIKLKGNLTLMSIENKSNIDIYNNLKDKILISLDISNLNNISFFALNMLNHIIHTISHEFGLLWELNQPSKNNKITNKFITYRFHEVNKLFLNNNEWYQSPVGQDNMSYEMDFGVFLFDKVRRGKIVRSFIAFLSRFRDIYKDFLEERIPIEYEYKFRTHKSHYNYLSRFNLICSIAYELIENAIIHSGGSVGYISALVYKYHLLLFIGDCGLGLKKGILENYDMSDSIQTDTDAISYLFNLYGLKDKRREKHNFNLGAGFGLKDTLSNIFALNGKFIFRSGTAIGSFVNPVKKSSSPTKIFNSNLDIAGTQYMIIIPISKSAMLTVNTTDEFMNMED